MSNHNRIDIKQRVVDYCVFEARENSSGFATISFDEILFHHGLSLFDNEQMIEEIYALLDEREEIIECGTIDEAFRDNELIFTIGSDYCNLTDNVFPADLVSLWDEGGVFRAVTTRCMVNSQTGEVFDIGESAENPPMGELVNEYILVNEAPVVVTPLSKRCKGGFWYRDDLTQ